MHSPGLAWHCLLNAKSLVRPDLSTGALTSLALALTAALCAGKLATSSQTALPTSGALSFKNVKWLPLGTVQRCACGKAFRTSSAFDSDLGDSSAGGMMLSTRTE